MTEIHQQADEFEEQVSAVLQLRGYSVDRNCTVDGTQIDLIAKSQDPLNDLEYLVECCSSGNPVGISLVKEKAGVLLKADSRRRLLFVSSHGFTRDAKEFAQAKRGNPSNYAGRVGTNSPGFASLCSVAGKPV